MSYAIKNDHSSMRFVNSPEEIAEGEYYSETPIVVTGSIPEKISAKRYSKEIAGITVDGLLIDTDDRSKLLISGAALEAVLNPEYSMQWKVKDGFVPFTAEKILRVARAVRLHVQKCFDREAELLQMVDNGTYTEAELDKGWPT